jgi:hypothetical protein
MGADHEQGGGNGEPERRSSAWVQGQAPGANLPGVLCAPRDKGH